MVGGHRALRECLSGKDRQTDIVIGASGDKLRCHILGCLYAVWFQILSEHGCRHIHGEHDINAFHRLAAPRVMGLRARQDDDDKHEGDATQQHRHVHDTLTPALGGIEVSVRVAHPHRGLTLLTIEEIPQHVGYEQQQQQEIFFISKFHFTSTRDTHYI